MIRPTVGMVLAAGRGERLRPLTDTVPKPLVPVLGRPLLDHAIDRLAAFGVQRIVVNVHHLGEQIALHLKSRTAPEIVISREKKALETGGGVVHALSLLGPQPFFAVNGDSLWFDGMTPALDRLAAAFDPARHDVMLLLQRTTGAVGYEQNRGDFFLDANGLPRRVGAGEIAPYLYAGVQILSPQLFGDAPAGAFSLNRIYDRALAAGRLGAIVHDGEWYTVTDEAGLEEVRAHLARRRTER
ncbi:mannose-1-phosphate guanylyltransferase [Aliidongia dinghuensis]|uniref:Mannose-1-phosphate guanylyltransferase n=1 Tax=Aliidongia dinghuensis TaxID=1867774 RepID=A0A8J3E6D2_9PROT|nr:nucleotidyltransferase family protein [Aliidongia dinghuensis]GGF28880.1 mannose-1-phosphate guanylyltransferase [Aliidongia dinghuensis]